MVQIPLVGDFRPFFTIHDADHGTFVNPRSPQPGLLLGVTNPLIERVCKHWPHVISLGAPARYGIFTRATCGIVTISWVCQENTTDSTDTPNTRYTMDAGGWVISRSSTRVEVKGPQTIHLKRSCFIESSRDCPQRGQSSQ